MHGENWHEKAASITLPLHFTPVVALLGGNSRHCCVPTNARVRVECSSSGEIGSTVEQMVGLGAEEALYTCSLGSVDHGHWVRCFLAQSLVFWVWKSRN